MRTRTNSTDLFPGCRFVYLTADEQKDAGRKLRAAKANRDAATDPAERKRWDDEYRSHRDLLAMMMVGVVVSMVRRWRGREHVSQDDMASAAMLGILRYIDHYDPDNHDQNATTYLHWAAMHGIRTYFEKEHLTVRIPSCLHELRQKMSKGQATEEDFPPWLRTSRAGLLPLPGRVDSDEIESESVFALAVAVAPDEPSVDTDDMIEKVLALEPDLRNREILRAKITGESEEDRRNTAIAKTHGVTRERVRQILERWRKRVKERYPEYAAC